MKRIHTIVVATALLMAGASMAEAASRQGSATGRYGGTVSSNASGSCVKGAGCSSQGTYTATGPGGKTSTVKRNSGTTCSGGSCTRNSTFSR
ncbi:MAG: hypothetical protein K2Y05_01355 [Hyphomicrobiaceae bacterium]|nr:hypothetical protein [Hyphomicrobiaceae bacterium]